MTAVAVISASGKVLMPTNSYRARRLLKSKRARIHRYRPVFTIQLWDRTDGNTQPVEYKCDTGYQHIGISICSQKHEYVNEQRDMLPNETERHNDCRKYRRARRNRRRHKSPPFSNRRGLIAKGGFAPSVRNKRDIHIHLFEEYAKVLPITDAVFEMGQFDTQVLKAGEEGRPLPEGADYQHGERYGIATLREAVFARDGHKCIVCGRTVRDGTILHVHHIGFWKGDRTNRMSNLGTVCEKCHTPKTHRPGGKLYGLDPKLSPFKGATFMTMVRWDMLKSIKEAVPDVNVKTIYGADTKLARKQLGIRKSHNNDAYCMGKFHPKHRAAFKLYRKRRRNNRILEKFYDARYIDSRDGNKKSGKDLGCERTNRREPRNGPKSLRNFRGEKIKRGYRSIRSSRYKIQSGDVVCFEGSRYASKGCHCKGTRVILGNGRSVSVKKVNIVRHCGGWIEKT